MNNCDEKRKTVCASGRFHNIYKSNSSAVRARERGQRDRRNRRNNMPFYSIEYSTVLEVCDRQNTHTILPPLHCVLSSSSFPIFVVIFRSFFVLLCALLQKILFIFISINSLYVANISFVWFFFLASLRCLVCNDHESRIKTKMFSVSYRTNVPLCLHCVAVYGAYTFRKCVTWLHFGYLWPI